MPVRRWILPATAAAILLVAYGAYALAASVTNGAPTKEVHIVAGVAEDGSMYFHCEPEQETPGACEDRDGHATILAKKRDRLRVTVRNEDGRSHSHDFRLEGAPYLLWPAGIEMELEDAQESSSFTAWARGEYRFVCELAGHEDLGMWGTLLVE